MGGLESRRRTSRRVQTTRYSLKFVWARFALKTMTEAFLLSHFLTPYRACKVIQAHNKGEKDVRKDSALPSMLLISTHNPLRRHLPGEHGLAGIDSDNTHVAALEWECSGEAGERAQMEDLLRQRNSSANGKYFQGARSIKPLTLSAVHEFYGGAQELK